MNLFFFLTIVQGLVAAGLVAVILLQRSEGGGLGIGGSPSGVMSARGAADFLSRATKWLAIAFVLISITLAAIAVDFASVDEVESTLDRDVTPQNNDALFGPAPGAGEGAGDSGASPAPGPGEDDPLADVTG